MGMKQIADCQLPIERAGNRTLLPFNWQSAIGNSRPLSHFLSIPQPNAPITIK
jgi:hypothetical protein